MRTTTIALVLFALLLPATVAAKPVRHHTALQTQQARYAHAEGYIRAIGKNAYRTVYCPRPAVRQRWQAALRWLILVRNDSRAKIRALTQPALPAHYQAWLCIHRFEGAWNANTGNGFHGGLQMDWGFMRSYGGDFLARWGGAENWPVWAQLQAAERAYISGRGFSPWPHTARVCGLL